MTTEQREAINGLNSLLKKGKYGVAGKMLLYEDYYMLKNVLEVVENQERKIIKQQEEIENITTNYKNLIADVSSIAKSLGLEEDATIDEIYTEIRILKSKRINAIEQLDCIQKKNKIVDLMARAIDNYDSQLVINTFKDKEHVKQYFADLIEKE